MRIGIDVRELCGRTTGVGRYVSGLLTAWAADAGAARHEFVLYAHRAPTLPAALADGHRFPVRLVPGGGGTWWEQVQLPAAAGRDHLDVLFSPAYTAPLFRQTPVVVTIHDLSFAVHPEWFAAREGLRRRWFCRQAALQAAAVITVSECIRLELAERYGIPASRLHVIPHGLDPRSAPPGGPRPPRVLYVGSIFNRRHVPDLIRAFGAVARDRPEVELDVVGDNRSYPHEDLEALIAREGLRGRVRWRAYVPEPELEMLYASARVFAFLSEYEGFGFTPLEALSVGVPPLLADTPIARESCGRAALYVPLGDLTATTRALERLLFDDAARAQVLTEATLVLARYDWAKAAAATLHAIEGACLPR